MPGTDPQNYYCPMVVGLPSPQQPSTVSSSAMQHGLCVGLESSSCCSDLLPFSFLCLERGLSTPLASWGSGRLRECLLSFHAASDLPFLSFRILFNFFGIILFIPKKRKKKRKKKKLGPSPHSTFIFLSWSRPMAIGRHRPCCCCFASYINPPAVRRYFQCRISPGLPVPFLSIHRD